MVVKNTAYGSRAFDMHIRQSRGVKNIGIEHNVSRSVKTLSIRSEMSLEAIGREDGECFRFNVPIGNFSFGIGMYMDNNLRTRRYEMELKLDVPEALLAEDFEYAEVARRYHEKEHEADEETITDLRKQLSEANDAIDALKGVGVKRRRIRRRRGA